MLGSLSGTSQGIPVGNLRLPLQDDAYTDFLVQSPGQVPLTSGIGLLDPTGRATVPFTIPAGLSLNLLGKFACHASLVLGPTLSVDLVRNPITVTFVFL